MVQRLLKPRSFFLFLLRFYSPYLVSAPIFMEHIRRKEPLKKRPEWRESWTNLANKICQLY